MTINNMQQKDMCSECAVIIKDGEYIRSCDGCFPRIVGLLFPEGSWGRQFHCHRGILCAKCDNNLLPSEHHWFCPSCRSTDFDSIDSIDAIFEIPLYFVECDMWSKKNHYLPLRNSLRIFIQEIVFGKQRHSEIIVKLLVLKP
jgi:hypothetical protein